MIKAGGETHRVEKRAIPLVRLVSNPWSREGEPNADAEKEIMEGVERVPHAAEVERRFVFNSLAGEGDAGAFERTAMEAFKPIRRALGPALKHLADKDIEAKAI